MPKKVFAIRGSEDGLIAVSVQSQRQYREQNDISVSHQKVTTSPLKTKQRSRSFALERQCSFRSSVTTPHHATSKHLPALRRH